MWWPTYAKNDFAKRYWLGVHGESSSLVTVTGCGKAIVSMSETAGVTYANTYDLELVSTGLSVLRESVGGNIVAYSTRPDLLSCNKSVSNQSINH